MPKLADRGGGGLRLEERHATCSSGMACGRRHKPGSVELLKKRWLSAMQHVEVLLGRSKAL